ncbi:MAG TPA: WecB/TagA/CpsF family glycosyltransferase [Devosia sp.]|nr:WecB/TagA/CpsF family glycosyltransferase [Devosia sp.]
MADSTTTFTFGDVNIAAMDLAGAVDSIVTSASAGIGGYVACCNTHSVVEAAKDTRLRDILNGASLNLPDGMPTVWIGKLKGRRVERVDGPSLFELILQDPRARTLRHYFYGSTDEVLLRIEARAEAMLGPGTVVGSYSPPLRTIDEPESEEIIARIAEARPDIIWVGLGLPKQEYWMARYAERFPNAQLVGIGAAFDWFSGNKPRAPQLMRDTGFEWLFRLLVEPRRLWRRYAHELPRAIWIMLQELPRR